MSVHRKTPNRSYTFSTMRARITQAETEVELDVLNELLQTLRQCDLMTPSKYRELDFLLKDKLSTLILEGKI